MKRKKKFLMLLAAAPLLNYVASSSGYRIVTDSVSVGGTLATSTSYSVQSSVSAVSAEAGTSTSFDSQAGYAATAQTYLAVAVPANVSLSPGINTFGGGESDGSAVWNVTTNSTGGYTLSIRAASSPALASAKDSFADYRTRVNGIPDYHFTVGDSADAFGFSPEGTDIVSKYKDDGVSLCDTGARDTADACWDALTTSDTVISSSASANNPSGTATTVKFRAQAGVNDQKQAGTYTASVIVTVTAL